jgi:cephalosporin-C deacetylase
VQHGSGRADTSATGAPEAIGVHRFNSQEGGQEHHWVEQLVFLRKILG